VLTLNLWVVIARIKKNKKMIDYKYKKKENKFTENGHTMFEEDVLQRLKRLAHLEEQIKQGQLLPIDSVVGQSEQLNHDLKIGDDAYIISKKLVKIRDIHRDGKIVQVKDDDETYLIDGDELEKVV
jgi:hypothetical protein